MSSPVVDPLANRKPWVLYGSIALLAFALNWWIVDLPFQLDDFVLVGDPWALFGHVDQLAAADVPAFMCRIPMWIAWGLVHAVTPEPLSPVPFHLFGLALHATAAVLIARVVLRHGPGRVVASDGLGALAAGGLFVAMGGALQAVSWTAAWSSLLYTIFALAAVNAALDGRRDGRRGGTWHSAALAGAFLYLAIITKVPAVVAAFVALLVLVGTAAHARAWRRLGVELAWSLGAIAAGMVTRTLFLGTQHLRYEERVEPGLAELPGIVASGMHALGQALFPWNRDPLFGGDEPVLASLGLSAPVLALVALLPVVVAAFAVAPRARGPLALLALCVVPAVIPPGVIYDGQATNVVAREAYLPLAVAAAALGLTVGALFARRAWLGAAAFAGLVLFFSDGRQHVAATEEYHADELRETRALLDRLADQQAEARPGRELVVLALMPDAGFGGIPSMGKILPFSHRPPFTAEQRLDIRPVGGADELADLLANGGDALAARDVILIGPECDDALTPLGPDPSLGGAANRERRRPRALTPVRPGLQANAARTLALAQSSGAAPEWRAATPLPAHAVGALALDVPAGSRVDGAFVVGDLELALRSDPSAGASSAPRLVLGLPAEPRLRLGPPIESVGWRAGPGGAGAPPASELETLASVPRLVGVRPAADARLPLARHAGPPPPFRVRLPDDALRPGAFARLELSFDLLGKRASVYHDAPAILDRMTPDGRGLLLELTPARLHLDGASPTPIVPGAPWSTLIDERILPTLRAGELDGASFRWRVTLYHEGGAPAARSAFAAARLVLVEEPE